MGALQQQSSIISALSSGRVVHGPLARGLAAAAGAGALVSGMEIYFEHDKASFGNRWMWAPIALAPVAAAAGAAGAVNETAAHTVLPALSTLVIANGLQGTYLHARGVGQKPGGWRNARYNLEMGPPLLAPLLLTMVGAAGLLAALLRKAR
jgi:hypothetical protein